MLFNSPYFIFVFLPLTAAGFFVLGKMSRAWAAGWLVLASFLFYASWNGAYLWLLLASICANYLAGRILFARRNSPAGKWILVAAIGANLAVLAYYKYAAFLIGMANGATGASFDAGSIVLPLGISFFTFTQIAFLADTYQGKASEPSFVHYLLFVSYFPHLIAGPILHHAEMMPQFRKRETYKFSHENVAIGATIFCIGLFKKIVLADGIAGFVGPSFLPENAAALTIVDAWAAALSYTFQIYFDFSGYSDMAIGAARMFNVELPLNFNSPYKATNIIDFWRRWHMTLSRFLRDYLYVPLGGNRKGPARRYLNLMLTMLLGGLWHGAGWTFVVWGGLHGLYLVLNHAWMRLRPKLGLPKEPARIGRALAWLTTFVAVTAGWVVFRAPDLPTAYHMLAAMFGGHGITFPESYRIGAYGTALSAMGVRFGTLITYRGRVEFEQIAVSLAIALLLPNTQQIMRRFHPAIDFKETDLRAPAGRLAGILIWSPSVAWAICVIALFLFSLSSMSRISEFLYYRF